MPGPNDRERQKLTPRDVRHALILWDNGNGVSIRQLALKFDVTHPYMRRTLIGQNNANLQWDLFRDQ